MGSANDELTANQLVIWLYSQAEAPTQIDYAPSGRKPCNHAPCRVRSAHTRLPRGIYVDTQAEAHSQSVDETLQADIPAATPGSPAAYRMGCTCDPEANNYGVGVVRNGTPFFHFARDCQMHNPLGQ